MTVPREGENWSPVYFYGYTNDGLEMATTVYYEPTHPTEVIRDDVNCRVNEALNKAGIEIPYRYTNVIMNSGT
jgi:small-conductance mechanosensitive channel